jgi:hypothetical protein
MHSSFIVVKICLRYNILQVSYIVTVTSYDTQGKYFICKTQGEITKL